jgi:hypothetical protein
MILILEIRDELWDQRILTENFLNPSSWRTWTAEPWIAVPSSYPLDHDVLVERIILELTDEVYDQGILTELWGRARKYSKSKSLNLNCAAKNLTDEFI